ncbi:DUF308 domain-containing protein [Candidatus Saccharibacteria bacterium]|nr:DUF308 domain-containing protein [Candidatus Saccharibacteria bacterium]
MPKIEKAEIIKRPIEQIGGEIKKSAWTAVIESLAILILGILFIVASDTMMKVVAYIVGAFFIVKGAFQIINYFIEKGQNDFFNNNLLIGVISVLIGITALALGPNIAEAFKIIVGIFMVYESLVRMNTAVKFHAAGISTWKYILLLALVIMALGIIVIFTNVADIIGWMMVIAGIVGIVGDAMFIQQVNTVVDKLTK